MKRRNNGEGTFAKTASGKIKMRLKVTHPDTREQKVLTVTGTSKAACIRLMDQKKQKFFSNTDDIRYITQKTLTDLCAAHLQDHLSQRGRLKPNSADRRECTINNQIAPFPIGNMIVNRIVARDITDHIDTLINSGNLSVSAIDKTFDVINSGYKWAIAKGYLSDNPCVAVKDEIKARLKQLERRGINDADVIILSNDEENALIKECRRRYKNGNRKYVIGPAVEFMLNTGMRVGEVCALVSQDWHRNSQTLSVSKTRYTVVDRKTALSASEDSPERSYITTEGSVKTDAAREIELSEKASSILADIFAARNMSNPNTYIFPNKAGKPNNPSNFDDALKTIYHNAGLDHVSGAHVLRRTFATHMYDETKDIKAVAAYLGDSVETVNKHYIAVRRRIREGGITRNIVPLPTNKSNTKNSTKW